MEEDECVTLLHDYMRWYENSISCGGDRGTMSICFIFFYLVTSYRRFLRVSRSILGEIVVHLFGFVSTPLRKKVPRSGCYPLITSPHHHSISRGTDRKEEEKESVHVRFICTYIHIYKI